MESYIDTLLGSVQAEIDTADEILDIEEPKPVRKSVGVTEDGIPFDVAHEFGIKITEDESAQVLDVSTTGRKRRLWNIFSHIVSLLLLIIAVTGNEWSEGCDDLAAYVVHYSLSDSSWGEATLGMLLVAITLYLCTGIISFIVLQRSELGYDKELCWLATVFSTLGCFFILVALLHFGIQSTSSDNCPSDILGCNCSVADNYVYCVVAGILLLPAPILFFMQSRNVTAGPRAHAPSAPASNPGEMSTHVNPIDSSREDEEADAGSPMASAVVADELANS